jgi:hypothetical protein
MKGSTALRDNVLMELTPLIELTCGGTLAHVGWCSDVKRTE